MSLTQSARKARVYEKYVNNADVGCLADVKNDKEVSRFAFLFSQSIDKKMSLRLVVFEFLNSYLIVCFLIRDAFKHFLVVLVHNFFCFHLCAEHPNSNFHVQANRPHLNAFSSLMLSEFN